MNEPELVIYPAKAVRTMDPSHPLAEAVAVSGDRVRAIGSLTELAAYGPARIDRRYEDSVLFPGFVEAHSHVMSGVMWDYTYVGYYPRMSPDGRMWPGCESHVSVVERLHEAAADLSAESPLIGWGLDPLFFPGGRFDRRLLDSVSDSRPILLLHQSNHALSVNSRLLRDNAITRDTTMSGVVKAADGEPTGELREFAAMSLIRSVQTMIDRPEFDAIGLRNFGADARNHGVTTVVDLGNRSLMDDATVSSFVSAVEACDFPARLSLFHLAGFTAKPEPTEAISRLKDLQARNSAKIRFGHVKLILDGSIQGFTARLQSPGYLADGRKGQWTIAPETFAATFLEFHRAGLTVHVHCNGDEATELFLDTVESALALHPRWDHRHTVTHSQLSTPAQYRRMAALGMCANLFSNHLWYWGDQHHALTVGPDRAQRMNAAATALRAGVPIALHCDTPVTPLDPLATVSNASARLSSTGRLMGAHERITVPEALHAVTLGAAFTLKMDHEVGSIEPGKFADFAVLGSDPYDCDPLSVRDVEVRGTVVGGHHFPVGP